jgi:hypothetical protein
MRATEPMDLKETAKQMAMVPSMKFTQVARRYLTLQSQGLDCRELSALLLAVAVSLIIVLPEACDICAQEAVMEMK